MGNSSPGLLHLSNEAGKRDLADEGVGDVQEGVHAGDKLCSRDRKGGDNGSWVDLRVITGGVSLYACKDGSQSDREEGEHGRRSARMRQPFESPWEGAEPGYDHNNNSKAHIRTRHAIGRTRHRVDVLDTNKDVESLHKNCHLVLRQHGLKILAGRQTWINY